MNALRQYLEVKIVPVAVVNSEAEIRGLADLCMKYLPAIELTLRTPYALTALDLLKKNYPELAVAAATVLSPQQADEVHARGTEILISPGFTPQLLAHCKTQGYTYIPGVTSPAELEQCLLAGYKTIKMFPAEVIGGLKWLKAIESVYQHTGVQFIPLGGLTADNVSDYLKMGIVACCGGSWLSSRPLIENGEWKEIEKRFAYAAKLIKELNL